MGTKRRWFHIGIPLLLGLGIGAAWYGPAPLVGAGANSINVLEPVELGGVKQWISIRGKDKNNPVLLFLHGGPGSANLAKLRMQTPELEQHFVVVNWDQRGAGKSHPLGMDESSLTATQLRKDTRELVHYLRERFGGKKIYLMGFSWGTVLGLWTVHDAPEDFYAFISVSQDVSFSEGERRSLDWALRTAREQGNSLAVAELEYIDPAYRSEDWFTELNIERKWLLKLGGVYHKAQNYNHEIWMMLKANEYSLIDFAFWPGNSSQSLKKLWPELMAVDFRQIAPQIDVPVYFLVGRHDYNTPAEITRAYFEMLRAPKGKHITWFEDAAHDIFYDQPDLLVKELVRIKEQAGEGE